MLRIEHKSGERILLEMTTRQIGPDKYETFIDKIADMAKPRPNGSPGLRAQVRKARAK